MLRTFKGKLEMNNDSELLKDGLVWVEQPLVSTVYTVNIKHEIFTFSKNEVIFSDIQLNKYKDYLRLDPYLTTKFIDGTNYTLKKYYKKALVNYEIEIGNLNLRIYTDKWNKFLLNTIHNRYWLFNESKWFVTFILSVAGFIIALVALFRQC